MAQDAVFKPFSGPDKGDTVPVEKPARLVGTLGSGPAVTPATLERILHAMQYLDVQSAVIPISTGFKIDTPAVRDGTYWYVLACCVEALAEGNPGQSTANILLMPPGAPDPDAVAVPSVNAGIRLDNQNAVSGGNVSTNPNGVSVQRPFVIPPKWFVRFLGATAAAGGPFKYSLRMAYAELPLSFDALDLV